jgi:hypothetical protein
LKIFHDFRYIDDKAGMGKWEGDFFSQPLPPRKSPHARLALTGLWLLIKTVMQHRLLPGPLKGNGVVAAAGVRRLAAGGPGLGGGQKFLPAACRAGGREKQKTPPDAGLENLKNIISDQKKMSTP